MREFIFIRHAATKGNLEKRYIGKTDESVDDLDSIAAITDITADLYYVSPMRRCRQTARCLFPDAGFTVVYDLRECDFGIFEGKTADEMADNKEYTDWVNSGCLGDIPGGESVTAFKERCCRAFLKIADSKASRTVIVTHGGVIMAILERFGYPKREFYEYHIKNTQSYIKEWKDGRLI